MKLFNRLFNKQSEKEIIAGMRKDVDDMGFYISEIEKGMAELESINENLMRLNDESLSTLQQMQEIVSKMDVRNLTDRLENNLVKVENLIEKVGESE